MCYFDISTPTEAVHLSSRLLSMAAVYSMSDAFTPSIRDLFKVRPTATDDEVVYHFVRYVYEFHHSIWSYTSINTSLKDFTEVTEGYWKREMNPQTSLDRIKEMVERHHYVPMAEGRLFCIHTHMFQWCVSVLC